MISANKGVICWWRCDVKCPAFSMNACVNMCVHVSPRTSACMCVYVCVLMCVLTDTVQTFPCTCMCAHSHLYKETLCTFEYACARVLMLCMCTTFENILMQRTHVQIFQYMQLRVYWCILCVYACAHTCSTHALHVHARVRARV
jgi:hypothetical protein